MDITITSLLLTVGAGLASVMSPCVLPVVPIVVTGTEQDHRHRPLFIVGGLALTFIAMGVLSSLFGAIIGPRIYYLEKVAGALILAFGILMLFGVNLFKGMSFFSRLQVHTGGRFGGFFLGFTLGLVWIPCVGPMLSSILAMVASDGRILGGVGMLSLYSAGFAIPMLLAGYATQLFRKRTAFLREHPQFVRLVSGGILVAFGLFVLSKGILGFAA